MKPILFVLGNFPFYAYGFMLVLGFVVGTVIVYPKFKNLGIKLPHLIDAVGIAMIAGLIGGRICFILEFPENFENASLWKFFTFWEGGLVFHGGLICGIIAVSCYGRYRLWPLLATADVVAIHVVIALTFARIGCFLNGCCYGLECPQDSIFAVKFPAQSIPASQINLRGMNISLLWKNSAPVELHHWLHEPNARTKILSHLKEYMPQERYTDIFRPIYATQLISCAKGFFLFCVLFLFYPRRHYNGEVVLLAGILYGAARFSIELLRADTLPIWGTGFTDGQLFSIATFLLCAGIWLEIWGKNKIVAWKK